MLMAWGPYRFTVPNYSVETLTRSIVSRVEAQPGSDFIPDPRKFMGLRREISY